MDLYELFRADLWGCEPRLKSPTAWPPVSYSGPSRTAWASVLRVDTSPRNNGRNAGLRSGSTDAQESYKKGEKFHNL